MGTDIKEDADIDEEFEGTNSNKIIPIFIKYNTIGYVNLNKILLSFKF